MNGKIWVLGDAVVDLLPDGEGRLLQCPGGAPANVAVGVARLGGDSGFIGRVGDDPFGRFMRHTLAQERSMWILCASMRRSAPPRWWSISISTGSAPYLYGPSERRPVPSSPRISAVCRRPVAARLLHRSQRRAEPQHGIRGNGGDKTRRGLCQLRPQYPQRPVAGSAGPA